MGNMIAMVARVVFLRCGYMGSLGGQWNHYRSQAGMRYQIRYWPAREYLLYMLSILRTLVCIVDLQYI